MSTDFLFIYRYTVYGIIILGGMFMGERFKIGKSIYDTIKDYPYDELVKILAMLTIVEEEGLTPAVLEKWGEVKDNRDTLVFEVSRNCKEGVPNGPIPEELIHRVRIYLS